MSMTDKEWAKIVRETCATHVVRCPCCETSLVIKAGRGGIPEGDMARDLVRALQSKSIELHPLEDMEEWARGNPGVADVDGNSIWRR